MSLHSFPLIGIDGSNNEHPIEHYGLSPKDAAAKAAERYGYYKVLSGDRSLKRTGKPGATYSRMPLFETDKQPLLTPDKPILATLLEKEIPKNGLEMVRNLRDKGVKVLLVTDGNTGKPRLSVQCPITMTAAQKEQISFHAKANTIVIMEALEAEEAGHNGAAANGRDQSPDKPDPFKGRTKQEVFFSTLPQMPKIFTLEDFETRLNALGFHEETSKENWVYMGLYDCVKKGMLTKPSRSKYEMNEEYRRRKHPAPAEAPAPAEPATPKEEAPQIQLRDLGPPPVETPVEAPAAPPEPPASLNGHATNASFNPLVFDALLDLASKAALSINDDETDLAGVLTEACRDLESTVMEAVLNFTERLKPVIQRLNDQSKQSAARKALVRSLAPM